MLRAAHFQIPWRILKETVRKFSSVNGLFLASGLAFDVLLNCIPLLFLIVSAAGYTLAGSERAVSGVQAVLEQLLPGFRQAIADNLSAMTANRNRFGLVGFALFFIFSTATFGSVRTVLNTLFEVSRPRGLLAGKGIDFLMMLAAAALFVTTIGISSLLAIAWNIGGRLPFLRPFLEPGWAAASQILGFLFTVALFYMLYRYCPARGLGGRALWAASLAGAVLFELSKWVFTGYVSSAQAYVLLYGTLSGFLFFFLWIYYASVVFIFAATFGWVLQRRS